MVYIFPFVGILPKVDIAQKLICCDVPSPRLVSEIIKENQVSSNQLQ